MMKLIQIFNLKIDLHCLLKDLGITTLFCDITFFNSTLLEVTLGLLEIEITSASKMLTAVAFAVYVIYKAIAQITMNKQETERLKQERYKIEQEIQKLEEIKAKVEGVKVKIEQEKEMLRSIRETHDFMMEEEREAKKRNGQKD